MNPVDQAIAELQPLFSSTIRCLVDDEQSVQITATPDPTGVVFRVHVAPDDIGKVIGKAGRTARSLRTILGAASQKYSVRFFLDIEEEPGGTPA